MAAEHQEAAKPLNAQLRDHTSWEPLVRGKSPTWYGVMLTRLLLIAGGAEFQYVTGSLDLHKPGPARGRVYAFTDDRVIAAEVTATEDLSEAEVNVTTFRRALLEAIELDADGSVLGSDLMKPWPGSVTVRASYANGSVLRLPAERPPNSAPREAFLGFLPGLLADVTR